jgi:hypothetical protein
MNIRHTITPPGYRPDRYYVWVRYMLRFRKIRIKFLSSIQPIHNR